jgi:hypothetical protein
MLVAYGDRVFYTVADGEALLQSRRMTAGGALSEEEMKQYLAQRPDLKKALEDKAKAEATPAPKTTATPKGEVDPANGVMKNYQEGDEMSPADAAEAYC